MPRALVLALAVALLTAGAASGTSTGTFTINGKAVSVRQGSPTIVKVLVRGGAPMAFARATVDKMITVRVTGATKIAKPGVSVVSRSALKKGQTLLIRATAPSGTASATYTAQTIAIFG